MGVAIVAKAIKQKCNLLDQFRKKKRCFFKIKPTYTLTFMRTNLVQNEAQHSTADEFQSVSFQVIFIINYSNYNILI